MTAGSEVLFEKVNDWGIVQLNRPRALNALNLNMVRIFDAELEKWEKDPEIKGVIIKGSGRAFCAGGDIRALYGVQKDPGSDLSSRFYMEEYQLINRIHDFSRFYIAILDGITMGAGAGLSIHGAYRIVTENTLFAMPETGIGFFPDVGGSYFLSRLPGQMGMFLGLTGTHIGPSDALCLGLGTSYVPSENIPTLESSLINCHLHHSACEEVDPIIKSFSESAGPAHLSKYQGIINQCFSKNSVEEIILCLKEEQSYWARQIAQQLLARCPTSLKVTHRLLRERRIFDLQSALKLEYRLSQKFMNRSDYYEGVKAVLVDKSHVPQWSPATLDEVNEKLVQSFFDEIPPGGDLSF